MLRRLLAVALVLAVLTTLPLGTVAQPEDPDEDPVGELLNEEEENGTAQVDDAVDKTKAEVAAEAPAAEQNLLQELVDGTLGFVSDTGAAILDGVTGVASAVGAAIVATFKAIGSAFVWTFTMIGTGTLAVLRGASLALVWSVTGVAGIMAGAVTGIARGVTGAVVGAWDLLEGYAGLWAAARPGQMSPEAWAGVASGTTAAASAGTQAGLWQLLKRYGWLSGGVPLFSRISKDDLLDHPLRSTIYETIKTNPGIHVSALSRAVDAGWGTTVHHLKKLQEKELVAVRSVNNQKCYFENGGTVGRNMWQQISELKNATAQRIARFIYDHPLQPLTGISETLGISPSLASHHVTKLTKAGVLKKVRDGRFVKITVTEEARATIFDSGVMDPAGPAPAMAGNAAAA